MVLQSSGNILMSQIRTEYGIANNVPIRLSQIQGWGGTPSNPNPILFSSFYTTSNNYQTYPSTAIGSGDTWTKDITNAILGDTNNPTSYAIYKYTINSGNYAKGNYSAYANTVYTYNASTSYNTNEWPPSGAFDKIAGITNGKNGYSIAIVDRYFTNSADTTNPVKLWICLPKPISVRRYVLMSRGDSSVPDVQFPSKWNFYGGYNSNLSLSEWILLDSQNGQSAPSTLGGTKTYDITNINKYNYYMISFIRNNSSSANGLNVGDISLFASDYV